MDIATSTVAAAQAQGQASGANSRLSANFDTFLKLLTAQLQNQDPLEPMDSSEFTQQLVQYSSVEQQIQTNQNFETLLGLVAASAHNNAVSYIGKDISALASDTGLAGGEASWRYALPQDAKTVTLTVTNSAGKVVYRTSGETETGAHDFTWDGKDTNGNEMPEGTYRLSVAALDAEGKAISSAISVKGTVTAVDMTGTEPVLIIKGARIALSQVIEVSAEAEPH
jgi:flagellar basal-body rod modification protein FlgD